MDKLAADKFANAEMPEAEQWSIAQAEQNEQEKLNIDYWNENHIITNNLIREADEQQRNKDAKFWAAQDKKNRELEAADRQAIADFWLAYYKMKQKLANDSRPSNLNFGLL